MADRLARNELLATTKSRGHRKKLSLIARRLLGGTPLFLRELQDAPLRWIDEVCGFAFASDNAASALDCRNGRPEMKFSPIIHLGHRESRSLGCRCVKNLSFRRVVNVVQTRTR